MAGPVRWCLTARLQQEGVEESERDPWQGEQPDATEGEDIAAYDLDVDYEGSEPKDEPDAWEQREDDPDAAHAKMEMPRNGTLHQRMMPQEKYTGIMWVHKAWGPEIMAS